LHIAGEFLGGLVAPPDVLFESPKGDPIELAAQLLDEFSRLGSASFRDLKRALAQFGDAGAGGRRLFFLDAAQYLSQGLAAKTGAVERRRSGQQLVEHDAQ